MDSKDRHHAVDGASLGRTNWIKSRIGLGQVLLRMPLGPSLPLCVFSAGALLPEAPAASQGSQGKAQGLGDQISLQSEQEMS